MDGQPAPLEGDACGEQELGSRVVVHAAGPDLSRLTGVAGMFRNHADRVVR